MRISEVSHVTYFAYGHNTNNSEIKRRCPSAKLLGTGVLKNFEFVLKHFADIEHKEDAACYGVVWEITRDDLDYLDKAEGYHKHYNRIMVEVHLGKKKIQAMAYIMEPDYESEGLPTKKYVRMLAKGYEENDIPIQQLEHAVDECIARNKSQK